jgi:hypothetical protein
MAEIDNFRIYLMTGRFNPAESIHVLLSCWLFLNARFSGSEYHHRRPKLK